MNEGDEGSDEPNTNRGCEAVTK